MNKGTIFGLILVIGGFLLWIGYGLYLGWEEIMQALNLATVIIGGLIVIGFIILLVSIIIEQVGDMRKRRQEIKKEDFEP